MLVLIMGLLLFLGTHSVRIIAEDWRTQQIAQRGALIWKGTYALVSLIGFVLIVLGYANARLDPIVLWEAPVWTRHLAALLTLPAFIFIVAAYLPGTKMKSKIGHPMVIGVKLWAFAHIIANGTLADVLLFGSFLVWAILSFRTSRRRDKSAGVVYESAGILRDGAAVVIGVIAWGVFAMFLHGTLIGVKPFG